MFNSMQVLAVMEDDGAYDALGRVFQHSSWCLRRASSLAEAIEDGELEQTQVVLAARQVGDGDWRMLANRLRQAGVLAQVVVVTQNPDEALWADVLDSGCDLMEDPHSRKDVFQAAGRAWRNWQRLAAQHEAAASA